MKATEKLPNKTLSGDPKDFCAWHNKRMINHSQKEFAEHKKLEKKEF